MTVGTTTVKYANFLFQSPDWGLNSGFAGTGKIRGLLPWIHLHFTQCSPCEKQGEFAFIAGTSAINAQISPCNLRSGGCIPASPEPGKFAGCSPGYTCIYRRNIGDKRSNFPLQPPDWGFAPCPGHPQQRKYCLKGNTALRAVNFRVPPNGTLVTRDRI